jgi:molybdopterin converting factor small subunit
MQVSVRLFSVLRHQPGGLADRLLLKLPMGARVKDVLDLLKIDKDLEIFIAVNHEVSSEDHLLTDGDELSLIPAVAGGSWTAGDNGENHWTES